MGKWENSNYTECIAVTISDLEKQVRLCAPNKLLKLIFVNTTFQAKCLASVDSNGTMKLDDIIKELNIVTEPKDHSLLPSFLHSIVRTLTYITEALVTTAQHTICFYDSMHD